MSALYSDAVEPILIQVVPKYNPASYLEDTFATSMQVSRFTGFFKSPSGLVVKWCVVEKIMMVKVGKKLSQLVITRKKILFE